MVIHFKASFLRIENKVEYFVKEIIKCVKFDKVIGYFQRNSLLCMNACIMELAHRCLDNGGSTCTVKFNSCHPKYPRLI